MTETMVSWFTGAYPGFVEDMKKSDHNLDHNHVNPYHQEGDVWSHTMMVVLEAMRRTSDVRVYWAALLHDLGKPKARDVKNDRVRFFGHEGLSAFMALDVLNTAVEAGMFNKKDIQFVFRLIARHTDLFGRHIESPKKLKKTAESFGDDMDFFHALVLLSESDSAGRFVDPEKVPTQGLDYESMDAIRDTIGTSAIRPGSYIDYPKIVVLIGPPLSGKSTWIENIDYGNNEPTVICRDDLLMDMYARGGTYQEAWEAADQKHVDKVLMQKFNVAVKNRDKIIIDMTNMSAKSRRRWLAGVPRDYVKEAIVFATPANKLSVRNLNRYEDEKKFIPDYVIENMMKRYTDPGYDEFDAIDYAFPYAYDS